MTMLDLPVHTPVHITGVKDFAYLIEPRRNNEVFFTGVDTNRRLKCGPRLRIKNDGGRGPWARWQVVGDSNEGFSLQSVGHRDRGQDVYLGTRNGVLVAVDHPEPLKLEPVSDEGPDEEAMPMPAQEPYEMSDALRKEFIENGYVHLPGMVQPKLVENALRSINETLGAVWNAVEEPRPVDITSAKKQPGVAALLYESPLFSAVEALLGKGNASRPEGGQLALRFPNNKKRDPKDEQWHIDGTQKQHMTPFQLLVGAALSAQPTDDCGNLAVFPGCHGIVHDAVARLREAREAGTLGESNEDDPHWQGYKPILGPGAAKQLKLQPGDAVLLHQKLPHRISRNKSPHVRYMVYFRISNTKHKKTTPLGTLWAHFDGLEETKEM